MALSVVSQTIPVPTSAQQKMASDGTNEYPFSLAENVGGGRKKQYISTATTTLVLSGGGWLKQLVIPGGGGTLGAITVYDALTATGNPVWGPTMPSPSTEIPLNIRCDTGIT